MPGRQSGLLRILSVRPVEARGGTSKRPSPYDPAARAQGASGTSGSMLGQDFGPIRGRGPPSTSQPCPTHLQPGGLGLRVAQLGPRLPAHHLWRRDTCVVAFGTMLHYMRTSWATVPFSGIFQGPRGAEQHITIFAQMACPLADGSCFARLKNSHRGEVQESATDLRPFKGETHGQLAGGRGLVQGAPRQPSVQRRGHAGQFSWTWNRVPATWNLLEPEGQEQSQEGSCSSLRQVS